MKKGETGKWGEQIAVEHLTGHGYAIVDCNWRVDHFEVDIIAMKDGRLVFVEVKTRSNLDADPLEAVNAKKKSNLIRSANAYVRIKNLPHEIQFDVIAINGTPDNYRIEHLQDAFMPKLKTYR